MKRLSITALTLLGFSLQALAVADQLIEIGTSKSIEVASTGFCKRVTNNCTAGNGALFVPNGTDAELQSFVDRGLTCATINDCVTSFSWTTFNGIWSGSAVLSNEIYTDGYFNQYAQISVTPQPSANWTLSARVSGGDPSAPPSYTGAHGYIEIMQSGTWVEVWNGCVIGPKGTRTWTNISTNFTGVVEGVRVRSTRAICPGDTGSNNTGEFVNFDNITLTPN